MSFRTVAFALIAVVCTPAGHIVRASGPVGIFAIVEKVVFEPNEANAERLQVWGAFAYAEGNVSQALTTSAARKGYMYFRLDASATESQRQLVRTEWADLKSVAGTGQAIGFGRWMFIGTFGALDPSVQGRIYGMQGGQPLELRVRPAAEPPAAPAVYQTNVGVVKLSGQGAQADIVKRLKDALGREPEP